MTAHLVVDRGSGRTFVHFALDPYHDEISVVGSFNDWVPGVHPLVRQDDGTLSVTVEVHHPGDVHFRYLGAHGQWFDDPNAHVINEHGSTLLRDAAEIIDVGGLAADPAAKKAPAKKAPAKKAPAKKAVAKKAPAKKAPAKKAPAKKAPAEKAAAKKAPAKKAPAEKAPAEKAAKKTAAKATKKTAAKKIAAKKTAAKKTAAKKAAKKAARKSG